MRFLYKLLFEKFVNQMDDNLLKGLPIVFPQSLMNLQSGISNAKKEAPSKKSRPKFSLEALLIGNEQARLQIACKLTFEPSISLYAKLFSS